MEIRYFANGKFVLTFKKAKGNDIRVAKQTTNKTSKTELIVIFKIL